MRIRSVQWFEGAIFTEMSKPFDKQFVKLSFLPKNLIEDQNCQIAEALLRRSNQAIPVKDKTKSRKLVE